MKAATHLMASEVTELGGTGSGSGPSPERHRLSPELARLKAAGLKHPHTGLYFGANLIKGTLPLTVLGEAAKGHLKVPAIWAPLSPLRVVDTPSSFSSRICECRGLSSVEPPEIYNFCNSVQIPPSV